MAQPTFLDNVRQWIAGIAFDVFLWASRLTADEYFDQIVHQGAWTAPHCDHGYNGLCPICDAMNTPPA